MNTGLHGRTAIVCASSRGLGKACAAALAAEGVAVVINGRDGDRLAATAAEIRDANPQVQWRSMARMRDRLVHDYFGTDLDIVWDVLQHKIPALRDEVRRILDAR